MNPQSIQQPTTLWDEAPARPAAAPSLLDTVLATTPAERHGVPAGRLDEFLREPDLARAVMLWVGDIPDRWRGDLKRQVVRKLNQDVGRIDALLNDQLNAVLHHPDFQKLEAGWRGLWYVVDSVPDGANVKVRVLNASWKDLVKDQERSLEFDQSQLFRKVYNEEFGTPGGEPYGLLVGIYEVCHRPFPDHPTDDVSALRGVASVAAAAFAPFVTSADPRFLELDSFGDLEMPFEIARTFDALDYLKWRQFRDTEDARFVGLTAPRMVLRRPYGDTPGRTHGFAFREDTSDPDRRGYLWASAAFGFAAVAVRAFAETGWLAEIRGARAGEDRAGLVTGLPAIGYGSGRAEDPRGVADAFFTDAREKELAELGFVPLCHTPGAAEAAFYTTPSVQKPKVYDEAAATANAALSSMLQYTLCVSRFAHYLKLKIRDHVGSYTGPADIEDELNRWLRDYVVSNDNASNEMKARYPLREGRAKVREIEGKPGSYQCTVHLRPHFQLDQLTAGIKLTTQLNARADT
jgi:type VI secretion system ImpC/EvpB family protein